MPEIHIYFLQEPVYAIYAVYAFHVDVNRVS